MALADHLRELRARLIRSALVLVIAFFVALFFYDQLSSWSSHPYNDAQAAPAQRHQDRAGTSAASTAGLTAPAQAVRRRRARGLRALLALPDLGLHRARAAPQRAEVVADVRRASPGRCSSPAWPLGYYVLPKGLRC